MRCIICSKESNDKLCKYHKMAYDKLEECYNTWRSAYKDITWEDYLKRILELDETGKWVKDVIKYKLESLFNE